MTQRTDRVADQIRVELSELFLREVRDPRVQLASVTRVEVSRDLGSARVHVSVLGNEDERRQAMEGLERARGFLRSQLAHRLNLRVTPDLKFLLDRGAEHLQEISDLLERIGVERTGPGAPEPATGKDDDGERDDS